MDQAQCRRIELESQMRVVSQLGPLSFRSNGPSAKLAHAMVTESVCRSRWGCMCPDTLVFGLYMANWQSSGDWQFKQPVAMALPTVILKTGWPRCWGALFLPGRVAR
jgi:hypothetical protein